MTASTAERTATGAPPSTMRAAVLRAPGDLGVGATELPEPGAGQVRVRLEGSGVCASSLPLWEGREWFQYPQPAGAPGHEGWGVVDALGPGVTGLAVGQRVAALSYHAFAEYDVADAGAVVPLPVSLNGRPVPGEPLGCAMNVFRRSDVLEGQTVAVVGIGFLGALLTTLAANAGARVIALSRRPFALEVARQFGAHDTIATSDQWKAIERVKAITGGRLCDRVIECVGMQGALDLASELTMERGRLVLAGFHQDGPRTFNGFLWSWRGLDVVNAHERDPRTYVEGMRLAVDALASGALDPSPLYTHRLPLDEAGEAMRLAASRPDGFLKALVTT